MSPGINRIASRLELARRQRQRARHAGWRWAHLTAVDGGDTAVTVAEPGRLRLDQAPYRRFARDTALADTSLPARVHVLRDVLLHVPTGTVATPTGLLISETTQGIRDPPPEPAVGSSAGRVPTVELAATAMFVNPRNYHHWLCECLTRVVVLDRYLAGRPAELVVPADLLPFQRLSLAWMTPPTLRLRTASEPWVAVGRLIWPAFVTRPGEASIPADILGELRTRMWHGAGYRPARGPGPRLIIVRGEGRPRRLVNLAGVVEALAPLGFETIRPESLELADQVRLFATAAALVSQRGAGLANMIHSQHLAVAEITARGRLSYGGYGLSLAAAAGHAYARVPAARVGHDLQVEPSLIRRLVEELLRQ